MRSIFKIGILTALLSSALLFGLFTLIIWLNAKSSWGMSAANIRGVIGLLSIPILATGIYLAMQSVKQLTGQLTYIQALKTGLVVTITVALTVGFFTFLYCKLLYPGFAEFMVRDAQKAMFSNGGSQQDLNQRAEKVRAQYTAGAQVGQALIGQFAIGVVLSLIVGLFVRSKQIKD